MSAKQTCRVCGCTNEKACATAAGPCHWVESDLCSACAGEAELILQPLDMAALSSLTPVRCQIDGLTAFCLVAALQLACRHEKFVGASRQVVEDFARGLAERIEVTPHLSEVLEAGWQSQHDVIVEEKPRIILPGDPGFAL